MSNTAATAPARGVVAAGATDPGRVRTGNEDRHYIDAERGIFLVVDGVGGHAAGEVAAAIAVDVIVQRLERPLGSPDQRVREAIALANNEILRQAEHSPQHMGMTCVLTLALLTDHRLTVGHVGDSRLYKFTPDGMTKLTHDHSPIGEREDAREISEIEAMQHPRRNEVFRDVGSAFHEPDDAEFVELIETSLERDAAILICSDGLTDMLPSTAIERTVRQRAGSPGAVAHALVDAANDAGGKDNITVVYVEGQRFATAARRQSDTPASIDETVPPPDTPEETTRRRTVTSSRAIWFALGTLAGVALMLALSVWLPADPPLTAPRARTLVVGQAAAGQFASIGAALGAAFPGDVVQIEPGEYAEPLILREGVDLVARVPGTVTLVAQPGYAGWTGVTAIGRRGNRITGIRILGRPGAPMAAGVRIAGHDVVLDDVTVEGAIAVGVDIANDGAIVIRSSRFVDVAGLAMRVGPATRPAVRQNLFVRTTPVGEEPAAGARGSGLAARGSGLRGRGPNPEPRIPIPVEIGREASPNFTGNLFVGYPEVQWPAPLADRILRDNYFLRGPGNGR